ncbi:hypothetical protein H696_03943 [Fonticula alba]|uniref:Uncharacterized protein n=1 Tax=Fonticula alba TaxID=691883 RepID=A0A058Z7P7_FONAL|nr:hypothetical protein H696_03943 [Fonticula alba]KCV69522.1 hypothetical protein H696_03943 [Fonticula alba]|eukprot:XP_009496087.1 hypothetical protein H696_03943 [Fonticula alba]
MGGGLPSLPLPLHPSPPLPFLSLRAHIPQDPLPFLWPLLLSLSFSASQAPFPHSSPRNPARGGWAGGSRSCSHPLIDPGAPVKGRDRVRDFLRGPEVFADRADSRVNLHASRGPAAGAYSHPPAGERARPLPPVRHPLPLPPSSSCPCPLLPAPRHPFAFASSRRPCVCGGRRRHTPCPSS